MYGNTYIIGLKSLMVFHRVPFWVVQFDCLHNIKYWLDMNLFQLNNGISPSTLTSDIVNQLGLLSSNVHSCSKNLGVTFEPSLCFHKQISNIVKSSFFQLRSLARLMMMYCNLFA